MLSAFGLNLTVDYDGNDCTVTARIHNNTGLDLRQRCRAVRFVEEA